ASPIFVQASSAEPISPISPRSNSVIADNPSRFRERARPRISPSYLDRDAFEASVRALRFPVDFQPNGRSSPGAGPGVIGVQQGLSLFVQRGPSGSVRRPRPDASLPSSTVVEIAQAAEL